MAEKGELVCVESVSPSPAVTPRQSMAEPDSSKQTDGEITSPAKTSTGDNQDVKAEAEQVKTEQAETEQAKPEADIKGSSTCSCQPFNLIYPNMSNDFVDKPLVSEQNGELSQTEGADSESLQEESKDRTEGSFENGESSKEEHPVVTVIVDGPDSNGVQSSISDCQPQPITNHNQSDLSENSEKPCGPVANQVESAIDQDLSNVSEGHSWRVSSLWLLYIIMHCTTGRVNARDSRTSWSFVLLAGSLG